MIKIAIRPNPHCDSDHEFMEDRGAKRQVFPHFQRRLQSLGDEARRLDSPAARSLSSRRGLPDNLPDNPSGAPSAECDRRFDHRSGNSGGRNPRLPRRPCRHGAEQPGPRPHRVLQSRPAPPRVAAGHSALGAVLYAEGNPSAAVPELEQAHSLDPNDLIATLNLALSYYQLGAYNKSLPLFQQLESSSVQLSRATSPPTPEPSTPPVIPSPPAQGSPLRSPRIPTTPPSTTASAPSSPSRTNSPTPALSSTEPSSSIPTSRPPTSTSVRFSSFSRVTPKPSPNSSAPSPSPPTTSSPTCN